MDLMGATEVRFGPFLAMTGGKSLTETDNEAVWKVWCDQDPKNPGKIFAALTREQAVRLAQACAIEWRRMGKPEIVEVGVIVDSPRGPFKMVINRTHESRLTLPPSEPSP